MSKKFFLLAGIMFVVALTIFIVSVVWQKKQDLENEKKALSIIGGVQFSGRVIHHKVYDFGGRNYYMVCVKLDYANVKSFYVFNDLCFLKIKDSIATMATGFYNPYLGAATYIQVNIGNDRREKYYYANGQVDTSFLLSVI